MAKYVYIDGKRYEVVNNYILGLDVYDDDSIPTPAVADSGKVLGVNEEGKYALTEAGGGGVVYCDFEVLDIADAYITGNMTLAEVYSALSSGNIVVFRFSNPPQGYAGSAFAVICFGVVLYDGYTEPSVSGNGALAPIPTGYNYFSEDDVTGKILLYLSID